MSTYQNEEQSCTLHDLNEHLLFNAEKEYGNEPPHRDSYRGSAGEENNNQSQCEEDVTGNDDPIGPLRTSRAECEHPGSLRAFISQRDDLYLFAVLTGIVWPYADENRATSKTQLNLRFSIWAWGIHLALAILIVLYLVVSIQFSLGQYKSSANFVVDFTFTIGTLFQLVLLPPTVHYIREAIKMQRSIDTVKFERAFTHSIRLGWRLALLLLAFDMLFVVFLCVAYNYTWEVVLYLVSITLFVFVPLNFFLIGVVTFLVVEQRVSLQVMEEIIVDIEAETLTIESYFDVRRHLTDVTRDKPINLLITATGLSVFLMCLLIVGIRETDDRREKVKIITSIFALMGRQLAALLVFLVQVLHVNSIADNCGALVGMRRWQADRELERCGVYISIKEHPIGTRLFGIRPSKVTIMLQLGSVALGLSLAIFYSVVLPHNG